MAMQKAKSKKYRNMADNLAFRRFLTRALLAAIMIGPGCVMQALSASPLEKIRPAAKEVLNEEASIEKLIEKAQKLQEAGDLKASAGIYERLLAWSERVNGTNHADTGAVLFRLGSIYADQGDFAKAESLMVRELAISEKTVGSEHPDTATSLLKLGSLYADHNQAAKAEPVLVRALAIYEKEAGPVHADTGAALYRLGTLFQDAENHAKAKPLLERALAIYENVAGFDDDQTAAPLYRLGLLYQSIGKYEKAEPLLVRELTISIRVVGSDHPDTAISLNNLAGLYRSQGLYRKAEPVYQRALAIREKTIGAEHPDTATSLNNLAVLYRAQGLYAKAYPLYQRALAISEKALGPEHPDTATSLNNLALLYSNQSLYAKAEPLYQRALAIREKALGPEHPDTAISLSNLAGLYRTQGFYIRAESLHQRALSIRKKALGSDHPDTAQSLNGLALLYQDQGLYSKAESLHQRAISILEKALGQEHPYTATSLNNLAALYETQGRYSKAEPLYQRAVAIDEKALGPEHPDTATSLNNLAVVYQRQGLYSKAEPFYQRALNIREKALGADHVDIAQSLNNLSLLYQDQGSYSKAEPLSERALDIQEKALGPDHPNTAIKLITLARIYSTQGLYGKADPLSQRALAISEKALGPDHPDTATSLNNLAELYDSQGLYSKADPLLRRGLTIQNTLIQREAPFLPRSERQAFVGSFDNGYVRVYSSAAQGPSGANLALFSRLNRQGLLEEIEKRQAQLASIPGAQQQVAQELRALTQQLSSLSLTPEQRQSLKARQEELEQQLYRLLPELKPRIVEVEQVAAALSGGSALVEFQRYHPYDGKQKPDERWGEALYLALVLKPDRSIAAIDLGPAAPIEERIEEALAASEQKLGDAQDLWAQVGDQILDPLASALSDVQTLFISPDGELNRIPFAALPAPGRTSLLTETLQLRLLTTGRELLDLAKPSSKGKSGALVVANPAYDKFARGGNNRKSTATTASASDSAFAETSQQRSTDLQSLRWAPLPGTAKEGQSIATLTKARLLSGEQATAAAVQGTPAPRVLHIASHAFYLADQAKPAAGKTSGAGAIGVAALQGESPLLRSGIALAGANQSSSNTSSRSDTADDGYLTALEVTQLDWKGTELVVISACESGKGDIQAGEGVYGLKRAIAVAGARSSLLSLWKVDDRATAAFMESFYNKLKTGTGRADALAATQKEFRDHAIAGWRHPYVWAAFQLSGDWGVMKW